MTPRTAIENAAAALVGASDRVDEAAEALQKGRSRVTLISRGLKAVALGIGAAAIPLIVVDVLTGGPQQRAERQRLAVSPLGASMAKLAASTRQAMQPPAPDGELPDTEFLAAYVAAGKQ